nr:barstar family protein [uncultured Fluviicola sp.]
MVGNKYMEKRIYIDFREITEISDLHDKLNEELGFPDFYGRNVNALIDCLQSMRFPEEGMSKVVLEKEEVLVLDLKNFSNAKMIIVNSLLVAVEAVNQREIDRNRKHSIILALS